MTFTIRTAAIAAALGLCGAAGPLAARQSADPAHGHGAGDGAGVPLYDDLGRHGRRITTASGRAQAYFDQGLRLQFAFNHEQAIRSYREALHADPECAMCWWGIALAAGPNINAPMSEAGGRTAYHAIREALRRTAGASPIERELIHALARRYGASPAEDRAALDSAYARAMAEVAREHGDDADILTLYGAALMNLSHGTTGRGRSVTGRPGRGPRRSSRRSSAHCGSRPTTPVRAITTSTPSRRRIRGRRSTAPNDSRS